ncbi:MAG: hypothetical protein JWS10_680 [Cypionkella sp.]|uniref:extracellular catalytic domain type 1 short-chain-length polyhydroxyalkanoate depolymerase n=1 Tax=Cypionkella sp. TaxID=2811411 RepID=UPI00262860F0|nr:PHB depolymerase family esterase [Cypionkella sp.]MDB5658065.1 hypothetical protein [Cypionkella sp.]
MNKRITTGMAKVTDLTRAGRLSEAAALIQSLLQGRAEPNPQDSTANEAAIDGEFTRLDNGAPDETAEAQPRRNEKRAGGLAETLQRMAAGRVSSRATQPVPVVDVPDGAKFLSLSHASAQGRCDYRLYVPSKSTTSPRPVVVMLHGCTQSPEDFAAGTGMNALAEEFGCLVVYPAQPTRANVQKCWNWFRPEDQLRANGEPALIAGVTRDVLSASDGDPAQVYIAGLSAGAAMALLVAEAYPEIFHAVGVHSGLPIGAARDIPSAFSAMRSGSKGMVRKNPVPTIIFQGSADATVHPSNGPAIQSQAVATFAGLTPATKAGKSSGGRAFKRTDHKRDDGRSMVEYWQVDGVGHAWAGGQAIGTYTDPSGPNASREMLRFFMQ